MGKRKRRPDHNNTPNPPFDKIPHSLQINYLPEQKCSHQAYDSEARPSSSNMDSVDDPAQVSQAQSSLPSHQHPSCSRGIVVKNPRHHYSRHYYRKIRSNHGDVSTFTGKANHQQESRERLFCRPEKIRDSFVAKKGSSSDMLCGLCEKALRKKPFVFDHSSSSCEFSVVAVLVCGHFYHADCLEQGTCHENRFDPPCPLCAHQLRVKDASLVHTIDIDSHGTQNNY